MSSLPIGGLVTRFAGNLRYPKLLMLTAAIFLADLFIPDFIPFVDEVLLALITLLLMTLKDRKEAKDQPEAAPEKREATVISVEPNP